MIACLCLNPSFDLNIYLDEFKINSTNISKEKNMFAGGKGVNVANMLACLHRDVVSINLLGKSDAEKFHRLLHNNEFIDYVNVFHEGIIRTNIKIINNGNTTEINEKSYLKESGLLSLIIKAIKPNISKNDYIVLSGSVPIGFPENTYEIIAREFKNNRIIVDASGFQLENALKASPFCIKPNISELENLANKKLSNLDEICEFTTKLKEKYNIKYILLSLGEKGSMLFTDNAIYNSDAINIDIKTTVGAGDTLLAGFIHGLLRGDEKFAYKYAVATCSAYISTQSFDKETRSLCENLLNNVIINEL